MLLWIYECLGCISSEYGCPLPQSQPELGFPYYWHALSISASVIWSQASFVAILSSIQSGSDVWPVANEVFEYRAKAAQSGWWSGEPRRRHYLDVVPIEPLVGALGSVRRSPSCWNKPLTTTPSSAMALVEIMQDLVKHLVPDTEQQSSPSSPTRILQITRGPFYLSKYIPRPLILSEDCLNFGTTQELS